MEQHDTIGGFHSSLEDILKQGAQQMLQQAIENEVIEYLEKNRKNACSVKRNGYLPRRSLQTGIGPVSIKQPRVRGGSFSSEILPKYLRRIPSLDALIPALYLHGISTGNMEEALREILGPHAPGLSATNVTRLKTVWEKEHKEWMERDLSSKHYVYIWADGIYFTVRLSDERPCLLVLIGALPDGTKELVAIHDGVRESKLSWQEVFRDLKERGLRQGPKLAIGDGALGFWAALDEEYPSCKQQRCWVHKTVNVLDKLPKSTHSAAKGLLHEMYMSETKELGERSLRRFLERYEAKYPKACTCLEKDRDKLFTFYDFPARHWQHIRTTNPIESTFATVRHRTTRTKGCGSRRATLSMVFALARQAEKKWRRLRGSEQMIKVVDGVKFKNGEELKVAA